MIQYLKLFFALALALVIIALVAEAAPPPEEILPPRLSWENVNIHQLEIQDVFEIGDQATPDNLEPDYFIPWSNLVYQSFRDGNWEIYLSPENTYNYERLTYHPDSDIHPRLNRGATHIVFASNRDGDYELYLMNRNGTELTQLTNNTTDDVNPTWSPNGTQIAFQSYRDNQAEIYVMNTDGSNQGRLTVDPDYDGSPSWSPDGTRIAFVSRRTGAYRIYVMSPDGSNVTQLSDQPYSLNPAWSPDGTRIAFDADGDGNGWQELWMMNADGSNQSLLLNPGNSKDAWARSWSPDETHIAFTLVSWVEYQGVWYWLRAYIHGWQVTNGGYMDLNPQGDLDWHPDWETTDNDTPQSAVEPLPEYSQLQDFRVYWSGADASSGLRYYDIQYKVGPSGEWTDWLMKTTAASAAFTTTPGTTVYFRSRAHDYRYNVESWSDEDDTRTTFYTWQLTGKVTDNRELPLKDVSIGITPQPIASVTTDSQGQYIARLAEMGTHTLTIDHPRFVPIPVTSLSMTSVESVYLPPEDDLIQNGTFETNPHQPTNWAIDGTLPISLTSDGRHTGNYGIIMGLDCSYPCLSASQVFTWPYPIPADMDTDSQGNLHVVWSGDNYYSFRSVDGVWSSPYLITDKFPISDPVMAVDRDDTVHIFWGEEAGVYHRKRSPSGLWTPPVLIAPEFGNPWVIPVPVEALIDEHRGLHVLVQDTELAYLERTPDGIWKPYVKLASSFRNAAMAFGPSGELHFAWGNDSLIAYRVRFPDGLWSSQRDLFAEQDYFVPEMNQLLVDKNGTVHLLFRTDLDLCHAVRSPEGLWSTPEVLPTSNSGYSADAVLDSRGVVHLINLNRSMIDYGVFYRIWKPDLGWETPTVLDFDYPYYRPVITVDKYDVLHMLWTNGPADSVSYRTIGSTTSTGTIALGQTITIPVGMSSPTLAFMQRRYRDIPKLVF